MNRLLDMRAADLHNALGAIVSPRLVHLSDRAAGNRSVTNPVKALLDGATDLRGDDCHRLRGIKLRHVILQSPQFLDHLRRHDVGASALTKLGRA